MNKIQWLYNGRIINFDPLIYNKVFELRVMQWPVDVINSKNTFSTARVSLTFREELSAKCIRDLKLWYNLGLSINGRERYIDIINDDLTVANNIVTFTCLATALRELLELAEHSYNA